MKRRFLRLLALTMAALLLCAVPAFAATDKPALHVFMLWENNPHVISSTIENWPEGAELLKVTSSNRASIVPELSDDRSSGNISLKALKAGKSKISVKYRLNGKTNTISATYTVKKYPKPFKSLKVNGTSVNLGSHKYNYSMNPYKKSSMTVKYSLNSGWKLVRSFYSCHKVGEKLPIKNGKKFAVKKERALTSTCCLRTS